MNGSRHRPRFRVGTASWTDPSLLESGFYPSSATTAEARLRFYAQHFDTVEVDSTFYALPHERNSYLWARRTPEDFVFHIKAFAALTQHPVEYRQLSRALRELVPAPSEGETGKIKILPAEALNLCFEMFAGALEPLRRAGKLGCLLFQFPPWFTATDEHEAYLLFCQERLRHHRLAVEFRHRSWFGERAERTLALLEEHNLVHVILDLPDAPSLPKTPFVTTTDVAYVRLHGRNREAWFAKHERASERFRYLYSDEELRGIAQRIRRLREAQVVHVIFNNCYRDYGVRNALAMARLLEEP
ncbi:MAG: hypothetical protein KatS3mg077_0888 [Candidatus Binatia bacterium]|nr:MAG: hypothetical protein KatS3mg077_0888 [Candidatus Binatia bacterium]